MRQKKKLHTLAVNATFEWYDKMAEGAVNELYREAKPYWCERIGCIYKHPRCFGGERTELCKQHCGLNDIKAVKVIKGYSDEYMLFDLDSVTLGKVTKVTWTDPKKDYFTFKVGKLLKSEQGTQSWKHHWWHKEDEEED